MSIREILAGSGAVKSIQTGYIDTTASTGSGEDARHLDVTISSVVISKCTCDFVGGFSNTSTNAYLKGFNAASSYLGSCRLTSSTNLRISTLGAQTNIAGRWTVVEYK